MTRICLILTFVLLLSAMFLVTVRYQTRDLFINGEMLRNQAHKLDLEWRRLQLERAELARNMRVNEIAKNDLHLVAIMPDRTIYLPQPGTDAQGQP